MSEKRLIDANALRAKVCGWFHRDPQEADDRDDCAAALCMAIDEAPTVAAEPVRHARWTMNSDRPDTIICNVCDSGFDVWKHEAKDFQYCPGCGARMDAKGGLTDGSIEDKRNPGAV